MAIAFRSVATIAGASSGSVTAPTPAGTVSGDIILIWTLQRHGSSSSTNSASLSGGSAAIFTQLLGYNTGVTGSGQHQFAVWIGRRGASYTAPDVDYTTGGLGNFVNSIAFSDSDPVASGDYWEDLTQGGPSASSPYGATAITTTDADRMAVQLGVIEDNNAVGAITGGTPGSWSGDVQSSSSGNDGTLSVEYVAVPSAGNVTGPTRTVANDWHSFAFALFGATGAGAQAITAALVTNVNSFFGATVGRGSVSIAGALTTNAQTFYGATVAASYAIAGGKLDNTQTFYQATVAPGPVGISGALYTNGQTFYGASIVQDGAAQAITGALFTNDNVFFGATVGGAQTQRGDDAPPSRNRFYVTRHYYVIEQPEPRKKRKPKPRKPIPQAVVDEAISTLPQWAAAQFTPTSAMQALPKTISLDRAALDRSSETLALVEFIRAELMRQAQDDEDEIELLLLVA